jgi:DNA-directed RNA polymerase specialized sigma subunit
MNKRREIESLWEFVEGNLKPDEVLLIDLYVRKQLNRQEVARLMELDRSTFTYRLDRCVKKLRYELLITRLLPQFECILPDKYFKTLVLYLQSKSQEQVAVLLRISQSAVSQRLTKAMTILKKLRRKEVKEFMGLFKLKLGYWGWPNEKKMFLNARIVREE